jgi:nucleotide-binding universal stress UspA family protein
MKRPLSTLVVAVNGSEGSISAIKYALAIKKYMSSRIVAVYVVDTVTIKQLALSRIFVQDESDEYERSLEETGKRYLALVSEIAASKRMQVDCWLRKGSISGEIIKAAEEIKADCIVVGGWNGDSRYRDILFEANRDIVRSASCPVIVVKGQEAETVYSTL